MLLQPLYENAVKHGVYESTESVRIITQAKIIDGYIEITISNNYDTSPSDKKRNRNRTDKCYQDVLNCSMEIRHL